MIDNSIKAIKDFKDSKFVIIKDSEDRENEADLVLAADAANEEKIAFMVNNSSGIVCVAMTAERLSKLSVEDMVINNTDRYSTPFTVSVDSKKCHGSGVSALDRAITIKELVNENSIPQDFTRPGHVFPLKARQYGVLERMGHTEASVDLAKSAGIKQVVVIAELMNEDGTMMRGRRLLEFSKKYDIEIISIQDIKNYIVKNTNHVKRGIMASLPTEFGDFKIAVYTNKLNKEIALTLIKGEPDGKSNVLTRVHSQCFTGETLLSKKCDCMEQLHLAMELIAKEGEGVIIYLFQEGRGIGLLNKIEAYALQDKGLDTFESNIKLGFKPDQRDYILAAQILKNLNIKEVKLLTNNPDKIDQLNNYKITVTQQLSLKVVPNSHNKEYLSCKKTKFNHML